MRRGVLKLQLQHVALALALLNSVDTSQYQSLKDRFASVQVPASDVGTEGKKADGEALGSIFVNEEEAEHILDICGLSGNEADLRSAVMAFLEALREAG